MIRFLPLLFLLFASPAAASERAYSVTDFDRIAVEGPFVVTLVTGRPSAVLARGEIAALERVAIDVQGRTLRIRASRAGAWGERGAADGGPVEVQVATRTINRATVSGAGRLAIDTVSGLRLDLSVEGAGQLAIGRVAVDTLFAGLAGSGRIALGGTAKAFRANIQGSGDLDAPTLVTDDAIIDSVTAGAVRLGARRSARVNALGLGDVEISGRPACTVTASGAGRVVCGSDQRQ